MSIWFNSHSCVDFFFFFTQHFMPQFYTYSLVSYFSYISLKLLVCHLALSQQNASSIEIGMLACIKATYTQNIFQRDIHILAKLFYNIQLEVISTRCFVWDLSNIRILRLKPSRCFATYICTHIHKHTNTIFWQSPCEANRETSHFYPISYFGSLILKMNFLYPHWSRLYV